MTGNGEQTEYFYLLNVTWPTPTGYTNAFSNGVTTLPRAVTTRIGALQYLLAELRRVNGWPTNASVTAFTLEPNDLTRA